MKERELPEGWKWKRLGDVTLKFINGGTPSTAIPDYWNGSIQWTTSKSITSCTINAGEKFISQDAIEKSSTNVIPKDNVLIASRVGIGKSAVNLIDIAISQDLTGVILDKKWILPEFLVRYLHNPKILQALGSSARGSTIKGLQRSDLERIEIPIPPLPVQRQIVAVLEQLEAVKRQRQEADALTGALLQSVFLDLFGDPVRNEKGWIQVKLGAICGITSGHGFKFNEYSDEGVKLLRINNVTFGQIIWDQIAFLPETYLQEYPKLVLKEGDLLIALNRPILGDQLKIGIMKNTDSPAILYQRVGRIDIRDNKKVDPIFLYHLMRTTFFLNELSARLSGSDQPYINPTEMVKITIPLPPLAFQQQFARVVQEVERIREQQAESKREIDTLFDGLMQRTFSGEIVA